MRDSILDPAIHHLEFRQYLDAQQKVQSDQDRRAEEQQRQITEQLQASQQATVAILQMLQRKWDEDAKQRWTAKSRKPRPVPSLQEHPATLADALGVTAVSTVVGNQNALSQAVSVTK